MNKYYMNVLNGLIVFMYLIDKEKVEGCFNLEKCDVVVVMLGI